MSDDWRKLTDAEAALIESCGPDEGCLLYNDEIIKLSRARIDEAFGHAFKTAMLKACALAGITTPSEIGDYTVDPYDTDKPYLRVTVTAGDGRQVSGIGMIPDPRASH